MRKSGIILFVLFQFLFSCKSTIGVIKKNPKSAKDFAHNFLVKEKIPGMVISVSKKGKLVWSKGFGYADIENKIKVTPKKHKFRIASISKPISAIAIATLIEENKIDLDSSIYTYLPNYPKKKYDFTIRQLGGHIAGIRNYQDNEFMLNKKLSISEGLELFKNDSLLFKPQSSYKYSTYNWCILSEAVQKITNTPYYVFVKKALFNPLNMSASTIDLSDSIMPNKAKNYSKTKLGKVKLSPTVNTEYKVAGGGFLSTSEDLIKFGNEVLYPKLISEDTLKELITPQTLDSGKSTNYGFGFSIGKSQNNSITYNHSGCGIGASTLLLIYPEEEVVIVILTNLSKVPVFDIGKTLERFFVN